MTHDRATERADDDFLETDLKFEIENLPSWLQKATLLRVLTAVLLGLVAAGFLPWRETVYVPVTISTTESPVSIPARTAGPILSLDVKEGDLVNRDQRIGVIGTHEEIRAMLELQSYVDALLTSRVPRAPLPQMPTVSLGGRVQAAYDELSKAANELQLRAQLGVNDSRISGHRRSLDALNRKRRSTDEQIKLKRDVVSISRERLERYQQLADRGFVSKDDLLSLHQQQLKDEIAVEDALAERESIDGEIGLLRNAIIELEVGDRVSDQDALEKFRRAAVSVSGELNLRRQAQVITAPVSGRVRYSKFLKVGESVAMGNELVVIIPLGDHTTATGTVPLNMRRSIGVGNAARVELQSFPSYKYGFLRGKVEAVSNVATDGRYFINIRLPRNLITSRRKVLTIRERSAGTAYITVEMGTVHSALFGMFRRTLLVS